MTLARVVYFFLGVEREWKAVLWFPKGICHQILLWGSRKKVFLRVLVWSTELMFAFRKYERLRTKAFMTICLYSHKDDWWRTYFFVKSETWGTIKRERARPPQGTKGQRPKRKHKATCVYPHCTACNRLLFSLALDTGIFYGLTFLLSSKKCI